MIKVSFIVPVYDVEKYLKECVDSILAQNFDSFEIILVDDGSPDSCPKICDEYAKNDNRIKAIHKKNAGVSSARNDGIKMAQGEYICFIDSDDYIAEDYAENLYNAAEKFNADIVQGGFTNCSENREVLNEEKPAIPLFKQLDHEQVCRLFDEMIAKSFTFFCWRNLFRRKFVKDKIKFDENIKIGEDTLFNVQALLLATNVVAVDSVSYFYRFRADSAMNKKYKKDYGINLNYQWSQKIELYQKYCENPSQLFYEDLAKYCITSLLPSMLSNEYKSNRKSYQTAKAVFSLDMCKRSFKDFDINKIRSKSLDWLVFWLIKHRLWFFAHLICRFVLYV